MSPIRSLLGRTLSIVTPLLLSAFITVGSHAQKQPSSTSSTDSDAKLATFGGGCFWCVEAVYQQTKGVHFVLSGYSGGRVANPSYKEVSSGKTGHAEVVQLVYDPKVITYAELLEIFWKTHDPTTLNKQGEDVGPQYRSIILYHDEEQRGLAEQYKKRLNDEKTFRNPVVTEIAKFNRFFRAENVHQNFFNVNRNSAYCKRIIRPKLNKFARIFRDKQKKAPSRLRKTNSEWRQQLTELQFHVIREKGTEDAFTGEHWNNKLPGLYVCAACNLSLFDSTTKFQSGTGWPSFWAPVTPLHIDTKVDRRGGVARLEVKCRRCDGHLGHVFSDGPAPTGQRFCINSASLQFQRIDDGETKK